VPSTTCGASSTGDSSLRGVAQHVELFVGDADDILDPEMSDRLSKRLPVARLTLVALATTGAGIIYGIPSASAKKCNPNINGEVNSGHGEQGNDDKPCPTEAPVVPAVAPAAASAAAPAAAPEGAPTAARPPSAATPVTAQPRTTG
jgi:hypothetical protein